MQFTSGFIFGLYPEAQPKMNQKKKTKTEREMIEGAKVNIGNSAHNLIYFYQHFIFVHKIFPIFFVFFFFHFRLRLNRKHTHARTLQFYYTLLL